MSDSFRRCGAVDDAGDVSRRNHAGPLRRWETERDNEVGTVEVDVQDVIVLGGARSCDGRIAATAIATEDDKR